MLHDESPMLHGEFSCILHAKEFLLYFTWPVKRVKKCPVGNLIGKNLSCMR